MKNTIWNIDNHSIELTHTDKLYWPEPHPYTKQQVLSYYKQISPTMLPYCKDRPVTLRVAPTGVNGPLFYLRDRQKTTPEWIRSVPYELISEEKTSQLLLIDSAAGIVWFANKGGLEFHLWSTTIQHLENPDQAIIDLDPGEKTSFSLVCEAAYHIYEVLQDMGLSSYAKTTGIKGMHIYIPISPAFPYDHIHTWIETFAAKTVAKFPSLLALPHGTKTHEGKHITIDSGQNALGKNTAAPYTLRLNHIQPTISTPLGWEEVQEGKIDPLDFSPELVLERIKEKGDLFASMLSQKQTLPEL